MAPPELARGLELIRRGEYFLAHEELETAWRAAPAPERDFFQGLVHVAVAWYHASRGNANGCSRQLAKAQGRLAPYGARHEGLDLEALLSRVREAAALVEARRLDLPPPL